MLGAPFPRLLEGSSPHAQLCRLRLRLLRRIFAAAVGRPVQCLAVLDHLRGYTDAVRTLAVSDKPVISVPGHELALHRPGGR